jgi:hypothetical protein
LIRHGFQLVSKQVDIPCDGILGRDFLKRARAKICYDTRTVKLNGEKCEMVGKTNQIETKGTHHVKIGRIKLSPRSEIVVRVPVAPGSPLIGMVNKCKLQEGVMLAASLTQAADGYAMTSILNTNEAEIEVQEPVVELEEIETGWDRCCSTELEPQGREKAILSQLRSEHLNAEERK